MYSLYLSRALRPATPLWQRAPTHDGRGRTLSDFMMIFPRMKQAPQTRISQALSLLNEILGRYHSVVVFADYNTRLNTLWVSVKPVPGICLELPAVINHYIPEALLVNQQASN